MAIVRKELRDVSANMRSAFQKAQDVLRKNNIDYGVELLKNIVQREPGFIDARAALRDAERRKAGAMGAFAKIMANIKGNLAIVKGKTLVSKKPLEAMSCAEDVLALYFKFPPALNLLAEAAEAAEANFIAIEALEAIKEFDPDNEANLDNLARIYEKDGQGGKVLQIRQFIASKKPDDLEAQAALRAAAALATMEKGKWNEEGSFQDRLKSKEDAVAMEKEDRIVRASDDVKEMIGRYEKMVADGDNSTDNRRKLAELYQRDNRHEDAIEALNWIVNAMGTLDPSIDKAIEKSTVAIGMAKAESLKNSGASEAQASAATDEVNSYRLGRAEERVKNYPNDLQLRYELASIYWEFGMVDNALEQFQLSQRNPQRRLSSMVYLGRCFHEKGQFDMAVEQFSKAVSEMVAMDKEKMNALYYLGVTYEAMGDAQKAMDCFKQIYSANVNFLDVAERMKKFYAK